MAVTSIDEELVFVIRPVEAVEAKTDWSMPSAPAMAWALPLAFAKEEALTFSEPVLSIVPLALPLLLSTY